MYGARARIGYTSPPLVSEIFPYEFYRMVPEGVTLALTTLDVWDHTEGELGSSFERTRRAALAMAEAGVGLIVLGGVPVLASQGPENVDGVVAAIERECGVPVTTAPAAYASAFAEAGAERVLIVDAPHSGVALGETGFRIVARAGAAGGRMVASTVQEPDEIARTARELVRANPDADTLWLAWPHRATVELIEPLEQELGLTVMSATQAIVWDALRRSGIGEPIDGFGRLMRRKR